MSDGPGGAPIATQESSRALLRRLELTVTRRLDGLLHGDHRGLVPGHGSEPGEARAYLPGDDVRHIDWNVTARMIDPHVRDSIADRELEAWLLVDRSPSLEWGTAVRTKASLALEAAAAVGFLTAQGGNRIGAVIGRQVVPARSGRANLHALLTRVLESPPVTDIQLGTGLARLDAVARRRGLTVVISDFLEDPMVWAGPLRRLGIRHDVLAVEIVDPRELNLPDVGLLELVDTETGAVREIHTGDARLRARYEAAATAQRAAISAAIRQAGADHLTLRTDEDWLLAMCRFVAFRRRRVNVIGTGPARGTSAAGGTYG